MPPAVWARECRLTVGEIFEASRRSGANTGYLSSLRAESRRHIARSTANQFVWCRLRGASPLRASGWIAGCLPCLYWSLTAWIRVAAALVLPRKVLRHLVLKGAARLAEARGANEPDVQARIEPERRKATARPTKELR
jgi:hypothetical protein